MHIESATRERILVYLRARDNLWLVNSDGKIGRVA